MSRNDTESLSTYNYNSRNYLLQEELSLLESIACPNHLRVSRSAVLNLFNSLGEIFRKLPQKIRDHAPATHTNGYTIYFNREAIKLPDENFIIDSKTQDLPKLAQKASEAYNTYVL